MLPLEKENRDSLARPGLRIRPACRLNIQKIRNPVPRTTALRTRRARKRFADGLIRPRSSPASATTSALIAVAGLMPERGR
jgi:hypothetical protein